MHCRPQRGQGMARRQQPGGVAQRSTDSLSSPGGGHYQRYSLDELHSMATDPRNALPIMAGQGDSGHGMSYEVRQVPALATHILMPASCGKKAHLRPC